MNTKQIISEEPIIWEVKILAEEKKFKQWAQENIKNFPPLNVTEEQRRISQNKISHIKYVKTKNSLL